MSLPVQLSNEYGDSHGTGKFRLHEVPAIVSPLEDCEFLEGTSVKTSFKATGVPVPEITWTKDGKKHVLDGTRVKLKKDGDEIFVVFIDDCKTEDAGHYVATVSNCEGSVMTESHIVINSE
ncbi:Immunoglobulin I-set [Trinorchestia longiramus]|nr:Immunoglobulin I-set [Trinorchestia longiramus]